MRTRKEPRSLGHQGQDRIRVHLAVLVHGRDHKGRTRLFADQLPRHDVGVMLEVGYQYFVAGFQQRSSIALRDEIDGLGGPAHENDFMSRSRLEEGDHSISRRLVKSGGLLAQGVYAAMDVGVVIPLVVVDRLDDGEGALR
jgi:hypothetical protein